MSKKYTCKTVFSVLSFVAINVVCQTKPLLGEHGWVTCGSALRTNHLDLVTKLKSAVDQHIVPRLNADKHKFNIFDCERKKGSEFNISIEVPYGSKCILFKVEEDGCITVDVPDAIV